MVITTADNAVKLKISATDSTDAKTTSNRIDIGFKQAKESLMMAFVKPRVKMGKVTALKSKDMMTPPPIANQDAAGSMKL